MTPFLNWICEVVAKPSLTDWFQLAAIVVGVGTYLHGYRVAKHNREEDGVVKIVEQTEELKKTLRLLLKRLSEPGPLDLPVLHSQKIAVLAHRFLPQSNQDCQKLVEVCSRVMELLKIPEGQKVRTLPLPAEIYSEVLNGAAAILELANRIGLFGLLELGIMPALKGWTVEQILAGSGMKQKIDRLRTDLDKQ